MLACSIHHAPQKSDVACRFLVDVRRWMSHYLSMAKPTTTKIESIDGPFPFSTVVNTANPNPAAHGGMTYRDNLADGRYRFRNVNGPHQEIGKWRTVLGVYS